MRDVEGIDFKEQSVVQGAPPSRSDERGRVLGSGSDLIEYMRS